MTKNVDYSEFPDIVRYAELEGISEEVLVEAFRIEKKYHNLLLKEKNELKRTELYSEFYSTVIPVYGRDNANIPSTNPKDCYARMFRKELEGKRIIDFGCGQGYMLQSITKQYPYASLEGVDVFIPEELKMHPKIAFREANLLTFLPEQKYDIALSDNVIEHLVKEDAVTHIKAIYASLKPEGKFILMMPNKLFGPADVTRIKDFSHSGKLEAEGGHVNESTYTEMIEILKSVGFTEFQTVLPVPKLKYTVLKNFRVGTRWIKVIENSPVLLKLFRSIKSHGVCSIRFTITIIAKI